MKKKIKKKIIDSLIILLCLLGGLLFVFLKDAYAMSTQQYNKIFLTPFYRLSMSNNGNYNYLLTVNPPDHIASVITAIISFDIYISPSVNFTMSINGTPCNTQFYYVSTTYASAGQSRITFDCSNVIKKEGVYNLTLGVRLANTGSSTGWLDLTYMNNPFGSAKVSGTEYLAGEVGTIFLQLQDSNGNAVTNGNCYLNIYYPNQPNSSHAIWVNEAPMLYKSNSKGLYFYDLTAPDIMGIYMIEAECSYIYDNIWYYGEYDLINKPIRTVLAGTYTGDTVMLNSFEDWLYTQCGSSGGKVCEAYYDFNISDTNITALNLYYFGESQVTNTLYFYIWNWTSSSWITLPNSLAFHGTSGGGGGYPSGVDEFVSNILPLGNTIAANKTLRIRTYTIHTSAFNMFDNYLSIRASKLGTLIQDVKGSGELHVGSGNVTSVKNVENVSNVAYVGYVENASASFWELRLASATEYIAGELGSTIFQFTKVASGNPSPINDGVCNVTIWYPNNTLFLNKAGMYYLTGSNGLYYKNFTVPGTLGIYTIDAYCIKGSTTAYASGTFHVSLEGQLIQNASNPSSLILAVNQSLSNLILASNLAVNQSIWNKLYTIQGELLNITNTLIQVNVSVGNISVTVGQINVTLGNMTINVSIDTTKLEQMITSVNDTLKNINSSVSIQLTNIQGDLTNIRNDINSVNSTVLDVNSSVFNKLYSIQDELADITNTLTGISNDIANLNGTVIGINATIMNKLYLIQDDLTSINDSINALNFTANFNTTEIENLIESVNQTMMNKLYGVQDELAEINYTVHNIKCETCNLTHLEELIDSISDIINQHNTSVFNKLYLMQDDLKELNSTAYRIEDKLGNITLNTTYLEGLIISHNTTVMNKLYSIQDDLSTITDSLTDITDYIISVNNTVIGTNTTVMWKLYRIQDELASVNDSINNHDINAMSKLDQILGNITDVYALITDVNATTMWKLYRIQDEITSVNDTVKSMGINTTELEELIKSVNQTTMNKLYLIQDDLATITNNLYGISNDIANLNGTVISINATTMWKLYRIQDEIASVNDSINNHDINVMNKLYSIQDDLYNITVLIYGHNATVMWKLYKIQDELAEYNQSMSNQISLEFSNTNILIQNLNNTMNWWGNYFDNWFWALEYKLDNIQNTLYNMTIGNLNVTAIVNNKDIAMEVLRTLCHYGAIEIWEGDICNPKEF